MFSLASHRLNKDWGRVTVLTVHIDHNLLGFQGQT